VFAHAFRDTIAGPADAAAADGKEGAAAAAAAAAASVSATAGEDFTSLVQEAKAALFERDFARAFGRDEVLRAYAARWSPTRAACYARVLGQIFKEGEGEGEEDGGGREVRVLAFGGATAELAAIAAWIGGRPDKESPIKAHVELVDIAPWQAALEALYASLTTALPPTLYVPVPPAPLATADSLAYTFTQADALALAPALPASPPAPPADVITLLFTLNELYTAAGVGRTTAFLLSLAQRVRRPGGVLVVVDSPGSYAETSVGKEGDKRRYPMKWLLDRTLLGDDGGEPVWEKVDEREGAWFRWGEAGEGAGALGWRYAVALEDMRFQLHVYRARSVQEGGS
jgi:25S rRNA (uracil2843-N3)-methyltransferase